MLSVYPIIGDVNFDHLVSARFLHCEGTIFPFVIPKYLFSDILILYECPILLETSMW